MSNLPWDKISGMVYGSLIGDALALGAHWIYDQDELAEKFGQVSDYRDPLPDSYHPKKKAGEQTHYGDQTLVLMESIQTEGSFQREAFLEAWRWMWRDYPDYMDHATKETLENLERGAAPTSMASRSDELGGAARSAPVLASLAGESTDLMVRGARTQTAVTHGSDIAVDASEFLARFVAALLKKPNLSEAIFSAAAGNYGELHVEDLLRQVEATDAMDLPGAARALGLSCPTPKALRTVLLLVSRCGDDFEEALIQNVMVGGDSAARGLALGMILGACHGKRAIPSRWIKGLKSAPRVETFLKIIGLPPEAEPSPA